MIRFVQYPQYFEPTRFAEARDHFVEKVVRHPWVKGIWQFGGDQPIPGYSDVDLLIWVDRAEVPVTTSHSPFASDAGFEGASKVFRHAPVVVDDESLLEFCYYVDPTLARFRQLAGPTFSLPVLGEADTAAVQLAKALDCLPRAFSLLVRFLNSPGAPVVRVVRQLNHFAIDCGRLCALDLLGGSSKRRASELAHDVAQLRTSLWREPSDQLAQELSDLLHLAFEVYFELMTPLDAAQLSLGFESPIEMGRSPTAWVTDVGGYVVRDAEDIRVRLAKMPPSHFHRPDGAGGMVPVVPVSQGFLAQMLLYAVDSPGEGFLDFLAAHWIGDEPALSQDANLLAATEREEDTYSRVVARRARLAHGHMEFLAERGSVSGLEPAFTGMLWTYRRMVLLTRRRGRSHDAIPLARRRRAILSARGGWEL